MLNNTFLKDKSFQLPIDGSENNIKTAKIRKVCEKLSTDIYDINQGGCGMFAVMLDSLFSGMIVKLLYINKINPYTYLGCKFGWHELFIHDGFCFDAFETCTSSSLFRQKQIKRIITDEEAKYQIRPKRFLLIKRSTDVVFADYQNKWYNPWFANRTKMQILFNNYRQVIKTSSIKTMSESDQTKIRFILNNYNSLTRSLAA